MRAAQEMLELFSQAARSAAEQWGYTYDQPEEAGIRAYMEQVQRRSPIPTWRPSCGTILLYRAERL